MWASDLPAPPEGKKNNAICNDFPSERQMHMLKVTQNATKCLLAFTAYSIKLLLK